MITPRQGARPTACQPGPPSPPASSSSASAATEVVGSRRRPSRASAATVVVDLKTLERAGQRHPISEVTTHVTRQQHGKSRSVAPQRGSTSARQRSSASAARSGAAPGRTGQRGGRGRALTVISEEKCNRIGWLGGPQGEQPCVVRAARGEYKQPDVRTGWGDRACI